MKNLTDFRKTVKTGVDPRLTKIKFNASRGEEYFARGTEVALTVKASLFQAFRQWGRRSRSRFISACSRFLNPRGPDYLRAWNRGSLFSPDHQAKVGSLLRTE